MLEGFGESVAVLTAGTVTDPYSGEPVESWDSFTSRDEKCLVGSGGSSEPLQDARNSVSSDFDLVFTYDPQITAQNRVVVRGLTCEVVGRPFAWHWPASGDVAGAIVRANIVEG